MQVILTEDEYLKLKCYHDANNKHLVRKIDITLALTEMFETLKPFINVRESVYDPITFQPVPNSNTKEVFNKALEQFWKNIEQRKDL